MEIGPSVNQEKRTISPKDPDPGRRWTTRLKRRIKKILDWLAKGSEHACVT